jgi:hypothetical protein
MEVEDMNKISHKVIIGTFCVVTVVTSYVIGTIVSNQAFATKPNESSHVTTSVASNSEIESKVVESTLNSIVSSKNIVSSELVSSNVSKQIISSSVSSQRKVTKMAENTQATVPSSQASSISSGIKITFSNEKYGVINPETGGYVPTSDPNYEKYKAELGGDAGTKPTKESTACKAALEKIKAKNEANATSSTTSSEVN